MIRTLQHEIDDLPETVRRIAGGGSPKGGLAAIGAAVALPPVAQAIHGQVVAWMCGGCGLSSPADMIHKHPAKGRDDAEAWRCSGCIERRYFAGEKTRAEAWGEMGQEGIPDTPYWRERGGKRRRGV